MSDADATPPQDPSSEPLDPIDPGAVALTSIGMTKYQVRTLAERVEQYLDSGKRLDSVRVEQLRDAYLRLVFVDPQGEAVDETLLFPTGPS